MTTVELTSGLGAGRLGPRGGHAFCAGGEEEEEGVVVVFLEVIFLE